MGLIQLTLTNILDINVFNNNNNNNNIYSCQILRTGAVILFKRLLSNTLVVTRKGQSSRLLAHPPVVADCPVNTIN